MIMFIWFCCCSFGLSPSSSGLGALITAPLSSWLNYCIFLSRLYLLYCFIPTTELQQENVKQVYGFNIERSEKHNWCPREPMFSQTHHCTQIFIMTADWESFSTSSLRLSVLQCIMGNGVGGSVFLFYLHSFILSFLDVFVKGPLLHWCTNQILNTFSTIKGTLDL